MNVARLNFSHGDHAEHLGQMQGVQNALKNRPHKHTSILLDTKGPEIRTGNMVDGKPVVLVKDQLLELSILKSIQQLTTPTWALHKESPAHMKILPNQFSLAKESFLLMAVCHQW